MNDFSDIENELKKLRPAHPSRGFVARVEQAVGRLRLDGVLRPPGLFVLFGIKPLDLERNFHGSPRMRKLETRNSALSFPSAF